MKQKKLMLLGGSRFLIPVIAKAHELGVYVITVDFLPENIAHKYSDKYINISIIDSDSVLKAAIAERIDGISAFACDPAVKTAAYVAEEMGLPFQCSYETACILQDKESFRNFLQCNSFNCPQSYGYTSKEEAVGAIDSFSLPVIVKPADSAGSKGVTRVDSKEKFGTAIDKAFKNSFSNKIVIEEFLDVKGFQSSTDMFTLNGHLVSPIFSDQVFDSKALNPFVPIAEIWPTTMSKPFQQDLANQLNRLFTLLKCKNGLYNIECRGCSNGEAYIMEVSPRGGGNHIALLQDMAMGTNYIESEIRNATRMPLNLNGPQPTKGHWCSYSIHPLANQSGILESVSLSDEIKNTNLIFEDYAFDEGNLIKSFTGANMSLGDLILCFDTRDELDDALSIPSKWINIHTNM